MPKVALLDAGLLGVVTHPAEFWARARNEGYPKAAPKALFSDVILAAQAQSFGQGADVTVHCHNECRPLVPLHDSGFMGKYQVSTALPLEAEK